MDDVNIDLDKILSKILGKRIMEGKKEEDKPIKKDITALEWGEVPVMSVKEFMDFGYLQEMNRTFLHPLGLALQLRHNGNLWALDCIKDFRKDDTGLIYGFAQKTQEELQPNVEKAGRVRDEMLARRAVREKELGYAVEGIFNYEDK